MDNIVQPIRVGISKELEDLHKGYFILLEDSLLGERLDVIRVVNTRPSHTDIIKPDGSPHWFAADTDWLVEKNKAIPFSHTEFAKLHVEAALSAASKLEETNGTEGYKIYPGSILNAYPLDSIK